MRLELCMQLRLFEADVHNSMEGLRRDVPAITAIAAASTAAAAANSTPSTDTSYNTPQSVATPQSPSSTSSSDLGWISDPRQAPSIQALEEVNVSCTAVLPKVEEVLNKGAELIHIFESVRVNFPAGKMLCYSLSIVFAI